MRGRFRAWGTPRAAAWGRSFKSTPDWRSWNCLAKERENRGVPRSVYILDKHLGQELVNVAGLLTPGSPQLTFL